jgi:hypothetical protein
MDKEYYSRIGEEVQRGVDPQELLEMGYESRLLSSLTSHIGEIASATEVSEPPETESTNLEKFTTRFSWVPRFEQEVNIAVESIEHTLLGKHIRDVEKVVDNIKGYLWSANNIRTTLKQGLTNQNELSTISPKKIREFVDEFGHYGGKGRNAIIDSLATQLLFQEEVLKGTGPWPHRDKKEGRISLNRLKPSIKIVNESSDEELVEMWDATYNSQTARARFWAGMIDEDSLHSIHPRIAEVLRERNDPSRGAYRR